MSGRGGLWDRELPIRDWGLRGPGAELRRGDRGAGGGGLRKKSGNGDGGSAANPRDRRKVLPLREILRWQKSRPDV